ncbi:hypothetical protein ABIF90_000904 [Bradyrhizobium japonicum]
MKVAKIALIAVASARSATMNEKQVYGRRSDYAAAFGATLN